MSTTAASLQMHKKRSATSCCEAAHGFLLPAASGSAAVLPPLSGLKLPLALPRRPPVKNSRLRWRQLAQKR